MKYFILVIIFFLFSSICVEAQQNQTFKSDTSHAQRGAEMKGNYTGGIMSSLVGGAFGGLLSGSQESSGRKSMPIITASMSYSAGSLVGMGIAAGLAEVFGWQHTHFKKSFQLGTGISIGPAFLRIEGVQGRKRTYKIGPHIRILSPEFGKWRYTFGASYFIVYDDFSRNESWIEMNLDIHYMIPLDRRINLYPFVGSYLHTGKASDTIIYGANWGFGGNYFITKKWNLFTEMKITLDANERYSYEEPINRFILTFGTQFYL